MPGFHTTGPNQALIISGGGRVPKVVVGGRVFVLPILQRTQTLSLEVMTLTPQTNRVYTREGVAVSVDGVAQVKVAGGTENILQAAQQFLGKRPNEVADIALQTMEGNQRAILGTMSVEEIYQDREGFATRVLEVAATDMANMGLEVVSFTIRDIQDEQGYLEALGVPRLRSSGMPSKPRRRRTGMPVLGPPPPTENSKPQDFRPIPQLLNPRGISPFRRQPTTGKPTPEELKPS